LSSNPSELFTPFLESSFNIPEEQDRLNTFLVDRFSNFADVINDKKIGTYVTGIENFNGEKWWYKSTQITRNGYQTFAYIASYPNAGVLTLTLTTNPAFPINGIDPNFVITNLWGTASKPPTSKGSEDGDYFAFYTEGNSNITFTMSDTQIVITTTIDMTAYSGFIVIEYLRVGT